jgi:glycosyltransferase involved in cell wall biosynthesis
MKNPLVSIIIPTFNRGHLIGETLNSIIEQTYSNWECIIIDDGSADDTSEILNLFMAQDDRIKYYVRTGEFKKGPSGCRNYGFTLSQGEYVNWFDSDDIMVPHKIQTELEFLETSNVDFTISQTIFFDNITGKTQGYWNEKLFSEDALNEFILSRIGWSTNAPLWKKTSLINNKIKFNEDLFNGDDFDYHIQALKLKLVPKVIHEIHVKNRIHPDRIENFKHKAYCKSIIVIDLLENKESLNLSKECVEKQHRLGFYLIKNMYKHKLLGEGLELSKKLYALNSQIFSFRKLSILFLIGSFYRVTNKGYSYFNKIN